MKIDSNNTMAQMKTYWEADICTTEESREVQLNIGENQLYPDGKPPLAGLRNIPNLDGSTAIGMQLIDEAWEMLQEIEAANIDGDTLWVTLKRPKGYPERGLYNWRDWSTPEKLKASLLDCIFRLATTDTIHVVLSKKGEGRPAAILGKDLLDARYTDEDYLVPYGIKDRQKYLSINNPQKKYYNPDAEKKQIEYEREIAKTEKKQTEILVKVSDNIAKVNEHLTEQGEAAKEATGDTEGGDASLIESLKASILTQDGERVEIDINMYMRREHIESEQAINMLEKLFTELLEINYDGTAESLKGEDFNFIIDFGEGDDSGMASLRIFSKDKEGNSQMFTLQKAAAERGSTPEKKNTFSISSPQKLELYSDKKPGAGNISLIDFKL